MPYKNKNKNKQREFQRIWIAARRKEWIEKNGPCYKCGSWGDLEVDHKDPKTKIDHKVWSWSEDRRNVELSKCQVLCNKCHWNKTLTNKDAGKGFIQHGTISMYFKHKCRCSPCRKARAIYRKEKEKPRSYYRNGPIV